MAEYTWPFEPNPNFAPEDYDEAVEFNVELNVARSGRVTTQSLPGARWRTRLNFPSVSVAYLMQRRQLEAFFLQQRGGADRLLLWNLLTPEPLGTMRGAVTLAATVAAGASSAQITGGVAKPNLVRYSGFELDANSDGLSDGWAAYSAGSTGSVVYTRVAGFSSPMAQRIDASALGSAGGDRAGLLSALTPIPGAGSYVLAMDCNGSTSAIITFSVDWLNASNAVISTSNSTVALPTSTARVSAALTAPELAVKAQFYVWVTRTSGTAATSFILDNVQLEQAAAATAYAGLPTLLRGDRIAFGGQRVVLTADATADDAGGVTVAFQPAHRLGASSGAAVTLIKPVTKYVMAQPVVQMAANGSMLPGFAVDLVEE